MTVKRTFLRHKSMASPQFWYVLGIFHSSCMSIGTYACGCYLCWALEPLPFISEWQEISWYRWGNLNHQAVLVWQSNHFMHFHSRDQNCLNLRMVATVSLHKTEECGLYHLENKYLIIQGSIAWRIVSGNFLHFYCCCSHDNQLTFSLTVLICIHSCLEWCPEPLTAFAIVFVWVVPMYYTSVSRPSHCLKGIEYRL